MPDSKAEQETQSRAREAAGIEPAHARATEVVDDAGPVDPGAPAPRQAEPTQREVPPLPTAKGPYDQRRADIVARFRTSRPVENEADRDQISDFARSGMPPEIEPDQEPAAVEQQAQDTLDEERAPAPQTFKVRVHGEERELTLEEITAEAQKSLAAGNILDEVKTLKRELTDTLAGVRAAPPGQPAGQPRAQPEQQPVPGQDGQAPPNQEDALAKLIETLQFGDPAEAKTMLQNTIAEASTKAAVEELQRQRLRDEGARTAKTLTEFKAKHADIAADPLAEAAIQTRIYQLQLEDLKAIGIDPAQIINPHSQARGAPADIAQAHLWYRSQGWNMTRPEDMLDSAVKDVMAWKGVTQQTPATPAAAKAAPRVDVTVDRTARRQAIPQQPSKTSAPAQAAQTQSLQPKDRSEIVRQEMDRRNKPRGRVGILS